jgi:hypothetical protein
MPEYPTFNANVYRGYIQNLVQRRFFPHRLMAVDDQFIVGFEPRPVKVTQLFAAFPSLSPDQDSIREIEQDLTRARECGQDTQVIFRFHDIYIHMVIQCHPYEDEPDFLAEVYDEDIRESEFLEILEWVTTHGDERLYDVQCEH